MDSTSLFIPGHTTLIIYHDSGNDIIAERGHFHVSTRKRAVFGDSDYLGGFAPPVYLQNKREAYDQVSVARSLGVNTVRTDSVFKSWNVIRFIQLGLCCKFA